MTAPYNPHIQWQADDKARSLALDELTAAYRQIVAGGRMSSEWSDAVSAEWAARNAARLLARIPGYNTPDSLSF